VAYPRNYQQDFTRYETVQRPDGTIRDVYINPVGLNAIRSYHILPIGTEIVIEAYNALKNADGKYVTDAEGHYVKGDPMPMIHVREKRDDWTDDDFTSNARNGGWNYGSFYTATGAIYHESLNACSCATTQHPKILRIPPSKWTIMSGRVNRIISCVPQRDALPANNYIAVVMYVMTGMFKREHTQVLPYKYKHLNL